MSDVGITSIWVSTSRQKRLARGDRSAHSDRRSFERFPLTTPHPARQPGRGPTERAIEGRVAAERLRALRGHSQRRLGYPPACGAVKPSICSIVRAAGTGASAGGRSNPRGYRCDHHCQRVCRPGRRCPVPRHAGSIKEAIK